MLKRRSVRVALGFAVTALVLVGAANAWLVLGSQGDATSRVSSVAPAQVAIVPGAFVRPGGEMSSMLRDRVASAADLYRAGKVRRVLVSGDHGTRGYDETDAMRDGLLRLGVPARAIFTDHAGFDTWATMVRARKVFGARDAIVVTQGFHMARALHLASAAGLDAHGLTSDRGHDYGRQGKLADAREVVARVKGAADPLIGRGVLLGPAHPLAGDGRGSWDRKVPPAR